MGECHSNESTSIFGLRSSDAVHGQVVVSCARGHKIRMSESPEKIAII